jgi:serine/threonine protein kinase
MGPHPRLVESGIGWRNAVNSSEFHDRAMALFDSARELVGAQRDHFLKQACGDDRDLFSEVASLLEHDASPIGFVARLEAGDGARMLAGDLTRAPASDETSPHAVPARVASYRVLEFVAQGGMGAVYRAQQENPQRVVALKVLRAGEAAPDVAQRLEREAHVLGRLQHPYIATVHDAGVADVAMPDGRRARLPFFAMEFIDGRPVDALVREKRLSLRAILELFVRICDAVQYAHAQGIIHRDLKPGNILVADSARDPAAAAEIGDCRHERDVTEAIPKVLDFGVARLADSTSSGLTLETKPGHLLGTVAYMSAEQAAGAGTPVDARADVYSLGVVLFELLSGQLPIDVRDLSLIDALQRIQTAEATKLGAIERRFRGDLETIVGTALERDPGRRYESVAKLAADVRRFLADEPIAARRTSTLYRLQKFARRNRLLVGAAAVIALVLLVGAGTSTFFAMRMAAALEASERASRQEQAVSRFLIDDLLAAADPKLSGESDLTLVDAVRNALPAIDQTFAEEPAIAARLHYVVSRVLNELADPEPAHEHAKRAVVLYTAADGPDAETTLAARIHVARVEHFVANNELAEALIRDVLADLDRLNVTDTELRFDAYQILGHALLATRGAAAAEAPFRKAHAERVKAYGEDDPRTILGLRPLGACLHAERRYEEALALYDRVRDAEAALHGPDHPTLASLDMPRGVMLDKLGRLDEADAALMNALRVREELLGKTHPDLGNNLYQLARVRVARKQWDEALQMAERAVALQRGHYDDRDETVARSLSMVASIHNTCKRYSAAEPYYREALRVYGKTRGVGSTAYAITAVNLGVNLFRQDRIHEAVPQLEAALARAERAFSPAASTPLNARLVLARCHARLDDTDRAAQFYRSLLDTPLGENEAVPWQIEEARKELAALQAEAAGGASSPD